MKRESTSIRLKKIMNDRNLKQVDVLNLTRPLCEQYEIKMNKSDISQYCSGKTEPNQNKLFVLAKALNVNEAWLMGLNVPMERLEYDFHDSPDEGYLSFNSIDDFKNAYDKISFRKNTFECRIIKNMKNLNNEGRKNLYEYSEVLLGNPNFVKEEKGENFILNAAHSRTDIEPEEDIDTNEDAIMDDKDF